MKPLACLDVVIKQWWMRTARDFFTFLTLSPDSRQINLNGALLRLITELPTVEIISPKYSFNNKEHSLIVCLVILQQLKKR